MAARTVTARLFRTNPGIPDLHSTLSAIEDAPNAKRYVARGLGRKLFAIPFAESDGVGLKSLRSDAPDVHLEGNISPWDLPGDIAEGSYFRFFDDNTLVMIATGHGPRTTALGIYLSVCLELDIVFDPLVRTATSVYVASLDEVKRIKLGVKADSIALLKDVDESLGKAIEELTRASGSTKMRIVLDGTDAEDRATLWDRMRGTMRDLTSRDDLTRMGRARLTIPGEISEEDDIDLLKDRIAYQIEVPASGVSQQNAFAVASSAYDRYRDDFGDA